jgi:chemotaxis response regulator CheB
MKRECGASTNAKVGAANLAGNATINTEEIVRDVIVIGASAGGVRAVIELLSRLPAALPAFIGVVIHRGATSPANWSQALGGKTKLRVVEPSDGDPLRRGVVYVAPSDCHMTFEHERIILDGRAKEHRSGLLRTFSIVKVREFRVPFRVPDRKPAS